MPEIKINMDHETMDQITLATIKEAHAMLLNLDNHDEQDDVTLRSMEDVLEYFMTPAERTEWIVSLVEQTRKRTEDV